MQTLEQFINSGLYPTLKKKNGKLILTKKQEAAVYYSLNEEKFNKQKEKLKKYDTVTNKEVEDILNNNQDIITDLKKRLFPYQLQAVKFTLKNGGNTLLTHEMGLGKTNIALSWLRLNKNKVPAIVLCPQSLKFNWVNEIKKWYPEMDINKHVEVISGRSIYELSRKKIYIINYDIIAWWAEYLKTKIKPRTLIIDEIHYINNYRAKRTKAVLKYLSGIKHIIGLSGTPIKNRPIEFFTSLQLVDYQNIRAQLNDEKGRTIPGPVPLSSFARRYCGRKRALWGRGWDDRGATNTEELHKKLKNRIMLRRTKKEVLKQLPDKIETTVPIDISNRNKYREAENDLLYYIEKEYGSYRRDKAVRALMFVKFGYLRQLTADGKVQGSIEWINNFLNTNPGKKLVVFAIHKKVIARLVEPFDTKLYVTLVGGMSANQKNEAVKRFQTDSSTRLFFGNIQAAGVGITLTASDCVLFVEFPWTPGELKQAGDRCHRLGQKNTVNIYYLVGTDTIDTYTIETLDKKAKVVGEILDGKDRKEKAIMDLIVNSFKKRSDERKKTELNKKVKLKNKRR